MRETCWFCELKETVWTNEDDEHQTFSMELVDGKTMFFTFGDDYFGIEIDFCPFCGSDLEVE